MSYNKSEKRVSTTENLSDFRALKKDHKITGHLITYLFFTGLVIVICAFYSNKEDQNFSKILFVLFMTPLLYFFISNWFRKLKGKLLYNESSIHYEGYTYNFIPWKVNVDISFEDIATARVTEEIYSLNPHNPIYLIIKKHDNTELKLNATYFKKQDVTEFVYLHLLEKLQQIPCSTENSTTPTKLKVNLFQHTENVIVLIISAIFLFLTLLLISRGIALGLFTGILFLLLISIIPLLRIIYINIRGKFSHTDTELHYEGYSFSMFPEKIECDIPFEKIAEAQIWTDLSAGGSVTYYYDKLLIKTYDNTETLLNICYFNNDEVFEVIYQNMLKHSMTNPIVHPKQYEVCISKIKKLKTDYFEVFHNNKYISTDEDKFTLSVKTGDILVLRCNKTIQMFRLHDTSITAYNIEEKTKKSWF
jgi:hypothetical protein